MRVLCSYAWPGIVRQLRNCIERLVVIVEGTTIHADDLPPEMRAPARAGGSNLDAAVQETEKATSPRSRAGKTWPEPANPCRTEAEGQPRPSTSPLRS